MNQTTASKMSPVADKDLKMTDKIDLSIRPGWQSGYCAGLESLWPLQAAWVQIPFPAPKNNFDMNTCFIFPAA